MMSGDDLPGCHHHASAGVQVEEDLKPLRADEDDADTAMTSAEEAPDLSKLFTSNDHEVCRHHLMYCVHQPH